MLGRLPVYEGHMRSCLAVPPAGGRTSLRGDSQDLDLAMRSRQVTSGRPGPLGTAFCTCREVARVPGTGLMVPTPPTLRARPMRFMWNSPKALRNLLQEAPSPPTCSTRTPELREGQAPGRHSRGQ